jgi:hypothetical protein
MSWKDYERNRLGEAEETLRVIAALPAPDGLVERVRGRLQDAPKAGRVLSWPKHVWRGAAAAAIVCAVAGGAWGVYLQVEPAMAARNAAPQVRVRLQGGFANAGAMRTPDSVLKTEAPKLDMKQVDDAGRHLDSHLAKKMPPAAKKADAGK